MGQYSDIAKFMKELDNKYQKKWDAEKEAQKKKEETEDALIKLIEAEYKESQDNN